MGAFTRMQDWLNSWTKMKVMNYAGFVRSFAEEIYKVVPGLTLGPAWQYDPIGNPNKYRPGGPGFYPVGEKEGELWLSDSISPAQTWIWQNNTWNGLSAGASSTPASLQYRAKDQDDVDDPGLYREIIGGFFPTNITWWQSPAKAVKVKEMILTRDGNQNPTTIVWRFYDGGALARTYTDTITYSGVIETNRSRSYV